MADPIFFGIVDANGNPLSSASPVFVGGSIYDHTTLATRAAPTMLNRGDGQFGFEPTAGDETVGCVAVIDAGAGAYFLNGSRFKACTIPEAAPFEAAVLTDAAGALWGGPLPTSFVAYEGRSGALTPATINAIPAAPLAAFTFKPSLADIAAGVSYRIDAPAGATPPRFFGSATAPTVAPWIPPVVMYPANAIVQTLAGVYLLDGGALTLVNGVDGNLLIGPIRSANVGEIPRECVFVLQSGGDQPMPYMGQPESFYVSRVQVSVRSPLNSFARGEQLARFLHARAHLATPPGYTSVMAVESEPLYVGTDDEGGHRHVFNLDVSARR